MMKKFISNKKNKLFSYYVELLKVFNNRNNKIIYLKIILFNI